MQVRICDGKMLFSHSFHHDIVPVGKQVNRTVVITAMDFFIVVSGKLCKRIINTHTKPDHASNH